MLDEKIAAILRQLRRYLEDLYGDRLVKVILYGSYARGEARSDSDIDVLVVLQDPLNFVAEVKRTNDFIADLCLEYGALVSVVFVSQNRFQNDRTPFYCNVEREGIAV